MAQHDYVIDNSTGANVRADINSVLQAIASNNSGSSAPSATFASQFFADTSAGIMKLRNTSDNGYVNLFTLAGGIDVDAASNFNEDVTFTGATSGRNIVFDKSANSLEFADNAFARFGDGADFNIHHDGSDNYLDSANGNIVFRTTGNDNQIFMVPNGAVELYHDGDKKLNTNSNGVRFIGNLEGVDNDKIRLGNSEDLQIFHDGSTSIITDNGPLIIRGDGLQLQRPNSNLYLKCIASNTVELYFDGNKKFETTAFGITAQSSGDFQFKMFGNGGNEWGIFNQDNNLRFMEDSNERMRISAGGNIGAPTGSNIYNASDFRLKKNVETIENALTSIKQLRPVSFNWIDGFCDSEKNTLYGFIAQEVETVDNNLIEKFGEGDIDLDGKIIKNPLRVNEKFIIPMLVRAIQELESKVAALETV